MDCLANEISQNSQNVPRRIGLSALSFKLSSRPNLVSCFMFLSLMTEVERERERKKEKGPRKSRDENIFITALESIHLTNFCPKK